MQKKIFDNPSLYISTHVPFHLLRSNARFATDISKYSRPISTLNYTSTKSKGYQGYWWGIITSKMWIYSFDILYLIINDTYHYQNLFACGLGRMPLINLKQSLTYVAYTYKFYLLPIAYNHTSYNFSSLLSYLQAALVMALSLNIIKITMVFFLSSDWQSKSKIQR